MKKFIFVMAGLTAIASASAATLAPVDHKNHGGEAVKEALADADATSESGADVGNAALAAVLIHADWCSSCKILAPKVDAAKAAGAFESVDYVVLDYTGRDRDALFAAADKAGVGAAVRAHLADEVKTGWLLLVDRDDERVIGKVTKSLTADEISGAVKSALLGA